MGHRPISGGKQLLSCCFGVFMAGRVPFVDAQYWEWDPLTQFALELARQSRG